MIADEILELAVEKGVITAVQAESLRGLAKDQLSLPLPAAAQQDIGEVRLDAQDDEALRFVSGFADIFVSLGLVLFFGSSAYLINLYAGTTLMWTGVAVLAWLVAEFFSRRHRLALPSLLLLGLFAGGVFMTTSSLIAELDPTAPLNWWHPGDRDAWMLAHAASIALAGLTTAALTALHYARFRVPITIAAMAAALIAAAIGLVYWAMPDISRRGFDGLLLVAGLLVFFVAMRFDMSDLRRVTRRADIAFWLHLLAAPLIVHPLIAGMADKGAALDIASAMLILAIFLGLGLVSLVIDRRALLVSGLTYAGIALAALLEKTGITDKTPAATLLALGVFILLLSALWHPLRQAVLRLLPASLVVRLPHSHLSAS